jgi:hypothetical protein
VNCGLELRCQAVRLQHARSGSAWLLAGWLFGCLLSRLPVMPAMWGNVAAGHIAPQSVRSCVVVLLLVKLVIELQ